MITPQEPIRSGFTAASTTRDVIRGIDLSGKVAIVTGGYTGLGLETVRTLRSAGAAVIVSARDRDRAQAALAELDGVEWRVPWRAMRAGTSPSSRPTTSATSSLWRGSCRPCAWPEPRAVSVSSLGHRYSPVVFEDPNFERRAYDPWAAYGQSKTANILFAVALDARSQEEGISAFSLDPGGIVETGLGKYVSREQLRAAGVIDEHGKPIIDPERQLKTVEQGAATIAWCATSPRLDGMGGVYCENCDVAPIMAGARYHHHGGREAAQGR